MKMIQKATFTLLALSLPLLGQAQEEPAVPAEPLPSFSPADLLEAWGWYLGQQIDLVGLELTDDELAAVTAGLAVAAKGENIRFNLEQIAPQVQEYLSARSEAIQNRRSLIGKEEAEAFFAELDANPDIITLASGLRYEVIEQGSGTYPAPEDIVVVHYTGSLVDGTVFDSSVSSGEPVSFQLNQVIPGWTQGLQKVSEGGEIRLFVPADLAYGDSGRPGIPPASTLIFDVELIEVRPAIPDAP